MVRLLRRLIEVVARFFGLVEILLNDVFLIYLGIAFVCQAEMVSFILAIEATLIQLV